ncbi:MAG: hypothetical protein PVSMB9_04880 [Candidatus Dormibacteria bacterium]
MPVEQVVGFYRAGLIGGLIFLLLFLLAFGAITVAGRAIWIPLGITESLLARIAAAAVLGAMALGGISGVIFNVLQPVLFSDLTVAADTARNQAALAILLALAITIVTVIRIELHHRARANPPAGPEEADWKVEPPEVGGRR